MLRNIIKVVGEGLAPNLFTLLTQVHCNLIVLIGIVPDSEKEGTLSSHLVVLFRHDPVSEFYSSVGLLFVVGGYLGHR